MQELTTTRHNAGIDPTMHVWGWEIPVYLFLGGLVAGMMIISGFFLYKGREKEADCTCRYLPILSVIFLSLGMFSLFLDLAHKLYVWRLYLTFRPTSPMSWGSWILILVYPALIANFLIKPHDYFINKFTFIKKYSDLINSKKKAVKYIGLLNIVLGGMLGMYTGVLLSTLGARPLWNSAVLWVLFLISGLSTAAAFVHMIAKNKYERELLAKADNQFIILEIVVIIMLLVGLLSASQAHADAARLLLTGPFAAAFWVFVVGMGLLIPLFIQMLAVNHKIKHTMVAPIMVLVGGLILRFIIVYAGQYSHWLIAHIK